MATNDDLLRELQKISAALSKRAAAGGTSDETAFAKTEAQLQVETERLQMLQDTNASREEQLKQADKMLALQQKELDLVGGTADEYADLARRRQENAEALKEEIEQQKKLNKEIERSKKVTEDFDKALKRNIKTFTGITDASDTLAGSFFNLAKEQGGVSGAFKQMRDTIGETITATSMATSVFAKFAEGSIAMAFALDSATAGFSKATGLGKTFNSQIIDLERNNRQF